MIFLDLELIPVKLTQQAFLQYNRLEGYGEHLERWLIGTLFAL